MRLYIRISKNNEVIPFNYQRQLTGCVHKWIGENNKQHGTISLYSFSWFQNVTTTKNGLWITPNSYFFLSFYETALTKQVVSGILKDPTMFGGMVIQDVQICDNPDFGTYERFLVASPILVKRTLKDNSEKHYTFNDTECSVFMTETLKSKLKKVGLDTDNVHVKFDKGYTRPKTKVITYGPVKNRVNLCPIIISGTPEQLAFAYDVGIGNSTGIGFGALKC